MAPMSGTLAQPGQSLHSWWPACTVSDSSVNSRKLALLECVVHTCLYNMSSGHPACHCNDCKIIYRADPTCITASCGTLLNTMYRCVWHIERHHGCLCQIDVLCGVKYTEPWNRANKLTCVVVRWPYIACLKPPEGVSSCSR